MAFLDFWIQEMNKEIYYIGKYTQYGFIRNGVIRNSTEILRIFKERLLKFLGIRNIEKKLRNKLLKTTNFS